MTLPNHQQLLERLREAVEHLAWPAHTQKEYLLELGTDDIVDELALEFDDAFQVAKPLLAEMGISTDARDSLFAINELLDQMGQESDSGEIWRMNALNSKTQWRELRHLAERSIALLS